MKRFVTALALLVLMPLQATASSCGAPAPILQMLQQVSFPAQVADEADDLRNALFAQAAKLAPINPAKMTTDERARLYVAIEAQAAETVAKLHTLANNTARYDATVAQQLVVLANNLAACTTEKRTLLLQALADVQTQGILLERLQQSNMLEFFEADCVAAIDEPGVVPYAMQASAFYAQCAKVALEHAPRDDVGHFAVMHRIAQPLCQVFGEDPATLTRTLLAALKL